MRVKVTAIDGARVVFRDDSGTPFSLVLPAADLVGVEDGQVYDLTLTPVDLPDDDSGSRAKLIHG